MNDEIKEILDIEKYRNKDGYVENINLLPSEIHKLLDYITNLQQINKNLTNSLNKKVEEGIKLQLKKDKLQEQFKDYKSRNEKAYKIIDEALTEQMITGSATVNLIELCAILKGSDKK